MKYLNVFVSGGSKGIGKNCVLKFLENGHKVYFTSRNKIDKNNYLKKDFRKYEKNLIPIQFDSLKFNNYKILLKKIKKLDCLVNNVGDAVKRSSFEKSNLELWKKSFDINFFTAYCATKTFLQLLKKSKKGSIVNISSISSSFGGFPDSLHYGIAKSCMDKLTQSLGKELGKYNITVNSVLPSVIMTDFQKRHSSKQRVRNVLNSTPLGRLGEVEDVSDMVFWLATKNTYISGSNIEIAGGR